MRIFIAYIGAMALGLFTLNAAQARDYSAQQRLYADDYASIGGGSYGGRNYSGNYYRGNNAYGTRSVNAAQTSKWEKPTYIAPTYKKQAVNFNQSATSAILERQRNAAERRKSAPANNSNYSRRALEVRLINMDGNTRPQPRINTNQVVLPQVAVTPSAPVIVANTPERVSAPPAAAPTYGTVQQSTGGGLAYAQPAGSYGGVRDYATIHALER